MARNINVRGKRPRKPAMSLKEKRLAKKEKQQNRKTAMHFLGNHLNAGRVFMWA